MEEDLHYNLHTFETLCLTKQFEKASAFFNERKMDNSHLDKALVKVSKYGLVDAVDYLLKKGADIHTSNDIALSEACAGEHLELVKFLVQNGADVCADESIALCNTCRRGYLDIVKFLVANGADVTARDNLPIVWAHYHDQFEVVKFLLDNGADGSFLPPDTKREISFCKKMEKKRRVWAANKIGSWWIPICHNLVDTEDGKTRLRKPDEVVETRMMKKAWKRVEEMCK
jgi:hypothetical protein